GRPPACPWVGSVRRVMAGSEFFRTVAAVRRDGGKKLVLGDAKIRPLFQEEIVRLDSRGNSSHDWSRVWVADGFDWRRVEPPSFQGCVVLGRFARQVGVAPGVKVPAGVFHSTVADCVIGDDTLIWDVKLLAH